MKLKGILVSCIVAVFSMVFVVLHAGAETYPWLKAGSYDLSQSIEKRISVPDGFKRVQVAEGSFAEWIRGLPLMPEGSPVHYWNGEEKKHSAHEAVIRMKCLNQNQECADAIMRLRGEYLWSIGKSDEVCFNFTSGDKCCWREWRTGVRPDIGIWHGKGPVNSSREGFEKYLKAVFGFSGTLSLSRDLARISPISLQAGDIIIQGGSPGHAVLVVDMAENDRGEKVMLLGRSYMPAQDFHILKNRGSSYSPWYQVNDSGILETPSWKPFDLAKDCRRFAAENNEV